MVNILFIAICHPGSIFNLYFESKKIPSYEGFFLIKNKNCKPCFFFQKKKCLIWLFSYLNICERAKNHVIEINLLSKENESSQQVWCSHPVLSRKKWKQLLFIFLLFDFFLIWIKIMTHETNISCFGEKLMDAFFAKIIFNIIPFCNNIITICIILSFTTQKACHRYLNFFFHGNTSYVVRSQTEKQILIPTRY